MLPNTASAADPSLLRPELLLSRERLVGLIETPYQARVTTIVAGAGFGKSTLAWQWAAQSAKSVCWISLEPTDDDVARFVDRLVAAGDLHAIEPPAEPIARSLLEPATSPIDRLVAGMLEFAQDSCVILDNCHVLTDARCIDLVNGLVARLPPTVSLILIGRRVPPFRLSRLRAQGQVRDITATDLRFTKEEAMAALTLQMSSPVPLEVLDRLWTFTGGWIAGFKLASISVSFPPNDASTAIEQRAAVERFLDEYILEEIIEPLPDDLRHLVLSLADLPFITPGLCEAVLEIEDGQPILARLVRDVPFLVPSNEQANRYQFSPLFAESLRRLVGLVSRNGNSSSRKLLAARWLLDQGEMTAAAELALGSHDPQIMVHVFNVVCRHYADRSDLGAIITLLDRVPRDVIARNLNMPYWWIVARLGLGRTAGIEELVEEVEPRWLTSGDPLHSGRAFLCRGLLAHYHGDGHETERRLTRALDRLPQDASVERLYAATYLGRSAVRRGRDEAAALVLAEAGSYAGRLPLDEQWSWRTLAPDRANTYALRGDLPSAITKYRLILSEVPAYLAHLEGFFRTRLVSLILERNDLQSAWAEFEIAQGLAGERSDPWHHDLAVAKARLLLASGQIETAEQWISDYVKHLRRLPEKNQMVLLLAQIWLERRQFSLVRSWLADVDALALPWIETFGDTNHRLLAIDLDLAEGRVEHAAQTAQLLAGEAASTLRWSENIAFSMRAAVALHHLGKFTQSRDVLRPALERGSRGGLMRHFQVPGVDTAWLFADVWTESPAFTQIRQRLQQGTASVADSSAAAITKRELEVLQLVARGRSNQQIADSMYISINTVRNHLVNICRRLDSSSRSEAVARARDLGILT